MVIDVKKNKIIQSKNGMPSEVKKAIIIIIVILVTIILMYLLTTRILTKSNKIDRTLATESVIGYDKILAGESFNRSEDEYYVIYFDSTNDYSIISSLVSSYQLNSDNTKLYNVDLSDGINKKYITDGDVVTTDAASLLVKDNTLLKFENGEVVETVTDIKEIINFLSD